MYYENIENDLYLQGYDSIACIDEVGRGCLLGDVVACAIIMPRDYFIEGVTDSKKISEKKREKLYDEILKSAVAIGIGKVGPDKIDEINIKEASRLAMRFAVENLRDKSGHYIKPDFLLIDAEKVDLNIPQMGIIKGDEKSYGIGCASIIAKVYRDRMCKQWDLEYPEYSIGKNKGYGTKAHREKILEIGPSPIHRYSFLKKILTK